MTRMKLDIEKDQYTYLYKWDIKNPVAVMHLIHGSMEHIGRYKELIKYLNKQGIAVYGMDLRGHGVSAIEQGMHGHINSYKAIVQDIDLVNAEIGKDHPGIKIVMYGHSMGSFVLRYYLMTHKNYDAIIQGTNEQDLPSIWLGSFVARMTRLFKGRQKYNKLIDKNSYGRFQKQMKPGEDWGSNTPGIREEFMKDEINSLNGFTNESFTAMFKWLRAIRRPKAYKGQKGRLFIIAGSKDPVGNMGKGPRKVAAKYKKRGTNVQLKIYQGGHHELHNDKNKLTMYKDVTKFIKHA